MTRTNQRVFWLSEGWGPGGSVQYNLDAICRVRTIFRINSKSRFARLWNVGTRVHRFALLWVVLFLANRLR